MSSCGKSKDFGLFTKKRRGTLQNGSKGIQNNIGKITKIGKNL